MNHTPESSVPEDVRRWAEDVKKGNNLVYLFRGYLFFCIDTYQAGSTALAESVMSFLY